MKGYKVLKAMKAEQHINDGDVSKLYLSGTQFSNDSALPISS